MAGEGFPKSCSHTHTHTHVHACTHPLLPAVTEQSWGVYKNVTPPLMETSESPLGVVRQLQKQCLVAGVTGVNFWIIPWFYGSMWVLCSQ